MPKKKRGGQSGPVWITGLLLAAVAAGGGVYLSRQAGDPFRTVQALDVADYLRDANGLRGNVYKIKGEVSEQLAWRADGSRLIAVKAAHGAKAEGDLVPLLLPASLRDSQLEKGQVFFFQVEVGEGGILKVLSLAKA